MPLIVLGPCQCASGPTYPSCCERNHSVGSSDNQKDHGNLPPWAVVPGTLDEGAHRVQAYRQERLLMAAYSHNLVGRL